MRGIQKVRRMAIEDLCFPLKLYRSNTHLPIVCAKQIEQIKSAQPVRDNEYLRMSLM